MSRNDLHTRPDPVSAPGEVAEVAWPEEADRRMALARVGTARLLLVAPGHSAPPPLDLYEDWVRVPAGADDVALRAANLERRVLERHATRE